MTYKFFEGASLTWREINIDWISIDESQLKAGTPMSAEGVVANDATAYGILMDDIDSYYNKKARVVTAGVCFLKRLQEHCGIALTAEARAALKNLREIEHDAALPFGDKIVEKNVNATNCVHGNTIAIPVTPEYIVVDGKRYPWKRTGYKADINSEIYGDMSLAMQYSGEGGYMTEDETSYGWALIAGTNDGVMLFDDEGVHAVEFIEVVTETVPIPERYLPNGGGFDGFVVVRVDVNGNPTCNMTRDEYNKHLKDLTISGGVLIHARNEVDYNDGVYYECEQYFITSFAKNRMQLPDECPYSAIMFASYDGTLIAELAGTGPM